jgi:LmbE family N-acetylglucosaminyl deacetylase/glycosyltransferase involved in cell wall biosynthesis
MSHESEAIPYEALDLRGERLHVLAPHPDDEVIGCGGLVALHLREGRRVRIVVCTDGTEAEAVDDREAYRALREEETRRAVASLGDAEIEFLRIPDRGLSSCEIPRDFKPDLILVPSAIEIHPDHLALCRAFCDLIAHDDSLFAELAIAKVAFYEVSQPVRPNALVDITSVADAKYAAIAMHESQTKLRDYVAFARGLNAYRAMTLPRDVKFAEAYWVTPLPSLRTTPFSALRAAMGTPPAIEVTRETKPVSVIVRTKDRPELLHEALASIRGAAEVIVVNDGGAAVDAGDAKLITHDTSRGRAEAANAGVRAATSDFIAFLDDDDLFYPDHLATISGEDAPAYSDAISSFVKDDSTERMRIFGRDFDRELLLVDNYIPLPSILIPRADFLDLGGFDPAFDLFEDWDFLIRLAQRRTFRHIARITCEVRHFEGSTSITLANPEGSPRFRDAKLQLWRKHASLLTHDVLANVFEREKRRAIKIDNELVEAKGLHAHFHRDIDRLERDKRSLIAEIASLQERINEATVRHAALDATNEELRTALGLVRNERNELLVRVGQLGDARDAFTEAQRTITALYAEIARLQSMLDSIFRSRTWKLHEIVERVKGRG